MSKRQSGQSVIFASPLSVLEQVAQPFCATLPLLLALGFTNWILGVHNVNPSSLSFCVFILIII